MYLKINITRKVFRHTVRAYSQSTASRAVVYEMSYSCSFMNRLVSHFWPRGALKSLTVVWFLSAAD